MIKKKETTYILDTHIWIWLFAGEKKKIPSKLIQLLKQDSIDIKISVISIWEVGMLEAKGKISLPYSCLEWVQRALRMPGISLVNLTPEIAIESSRLPGNLHGDPSDRIIVATTKRLGATLITKDKNILNYAKEKYIQAISS
jgi:PIN domain nuclease of toxin-antitoxin system